MSEIAERIARRTALLDGITGQDPAALMADAEAIKADVAISAGSMAECIAECKAAGRHALAFAFEVLDEQYFLLCAHKVRLAHMAAEIVELRERVGRSAMKYCGTFEDGTRYQPGDVVTDHGGMWVALKETITRPGDGRASWQLCVKRGGR